MYVPVRSTHTHTHTEGESGWMDNCVAYERAKDNSGWAEGEGGWGQEKKRKKKRKRKKNQAAKVTQNVTLRLLTRARTS